MERGDHRVAGALTRQREARVFPLPHAPAGIPITQRCDFHQRLRVFLCWLWTVSEPLLSVAISFLSPTKIARSYLLLPRKSTKSEHFSPPGLV